MIFVINIIVLKEVLLAIKKRLLIFMSEYMFTHNITSGFYKDIKVKKYRGLQYFDRNLIRVFKILIC